MTEEQWNEIRQSMADELARLSSLKALAIQWVKRRERFDDDGEAWRSQVLSDCIVELTEALQVKGDPDEMGL